MLRKSKKITMLCGIMAGILLIFALMIVLILTGVLSLNKTTLTFTTESVEALYDGAPLTNHIWRLSKGQLKEGHELKVTFRGSQTSV